MGDKQKKRKESHLEVWVQSNMSLTRENIQKSHVRFFLNGGFGPKSTKDNRWFRFSLGIVSVLAKRFRIGRRIRRRNMFLVIFLCFFVGHASGDFRQVTLPVYMPPSHEVLLNSYFHKSENQNDRNRTKKSILNVSDKFYQTIEVMKKELSANISDLEKELSERNVSDEGLSGNISEVMHDYIKSGIFKNLLSAPVEPTTYRYPTAVWSSQNYEKLKSSQRFRPRNGTRINVSRPFLHPAYVPLDRGFYFGTSERRNRGKTKWKDVASSEVTTLGSAVSNQDPDKGFKVDRNEFVDRFLEQSLMKYLISSNLRENVGNVSVKTFSDILRNITEQKPKRPQSPYDENKELRMKFLEEVILKKRNETKVSHGKFLEKQLQRRLEKVQDVFNEKDKEKILANMWKYTPLNRTTDPPEEKKNKTRNVTEEALLTNVTTTEETIMETTAMTPNVSVIYLTTVTPVFQFKQSTGTGHIRGTAKFNRTRYEVTEVYRELDYESQDENGERGANRNLLKLTAEESSYYNRKGSFPSLTFIGQPEKPGVIPGRPLIDYPVHSFPPATKFKCPKFKGGKPIMMADPETRCQVFYICTGDGPTTAMLCPNGTMFNENFLVCDWWYNVKC